MDNIQKITLDIMNNKVYEYIYTKQYDNGRVVEFTITEDGNPLVLTGYHVVFSLKKPDGSIIIDSDDGDILIVSADKVTLTLTDEMTVLSGKLPYQLSVYDNGETISTVTGHIMCDKAPVQNDDVVSTSGGNIVDDLMRVYESNTFYPSEITLLASGWSSSAQTVSAPNVIADQEHQLVSIFPAQGSIQEYINCKVICVAQGDGTLTFECDDTPENDLDIFILTQGINTVPHGAETIIATQEPLQPANNIWLQPYV